MRVSGGADTMNSKELNVNVPLASCESDFDEFEGFAEFNSGGNSSGEGDGFSPRPGAISLEGGLDSVTGSLEDLVSTFDEKLTMCFQDYQEEVEKIAPVQVRSQEEIMNECQVWWTLTGNFGNMMPIDWTKSYTRAKHLPTLNLCDPKPPDPEMLNEEDDIVHEDLDMHQLILNSESQQPVEHIKTADEVIQDIDDMLDDDDEDDDDPEGGAVPQSGYLPPHIFRSSTFIGQALQGRKLEDMSLSELTKIYSDIEDHVRDLSEELVADLGVRDELDFEKELKNNFISLLLSIQSKRRQHNVDTSSGQKRNKINREYKYLTTVIPYNTERGCPPIQTLQVLVKILKSINEDSPAVPALLTDYILKVLCPT